MSSTLSEENIQAWWCFIYRTIIWIISSTEPKAHRLAIVTAICLSSGRGIFHNFDISETSGPIIIKIDRHDSWDF